MVGLEVTPRTPSSLINRCSSPDVISPRRIWLLVVFVSGIAFLGYVSSKVIGPRRGIAITGLLGGIVSSTAVAVSMASRSREEERLSPQLALAVVMAATVMFPRTVIEVAFVNLRLGAEVLVPLLGAALFGVVASAYLWFGGAKAEPETVRLRNPFRLAPAFQFGLLFTCMLVASKYAATRFETAGIFAAAAIGGLIDTRPIALSVANLALGESPAVSTDAAIAAVMIAALANTFMKGALAALSGAPRFRRFVLPAFFLLVAGGIVATVLVAKYGVRARLCGFTGAPPARGPPRGRARAIRASSPGRGRDPARGSAGNRGGAPCRCGGRGG